MNLTDLLDKPAVFSPCREYRYSLRRDIGGPGGPLLFIMLNPSTADETEDDPTIRRCIGFATAWGACELFIANLFALRATDPDEMKAHSAPIEPDIDGILNDFAIGYLARHVQRGDGAIVCAWGNDGAHRHRGSEVRRWLRSVLPSDARLLCLGVNGTGEPKHPLYLKKDLTPVVWA